MIKKKTYNCFITDVVEDIERVEKKHLLLLVSGGSQLDILPHIFHQISAQLSKEIETITVSLVDERYYTNVSSENSNGARLVGLIPPNMKYNSILEENLSLEATANKYDHFLSKKIQDPNTYIVALLGIGEDGHTAGILPHLSQYTHIFFTNFVTGYLVDTISTSDNPYRQRVTINFSALAKVDKIFVYAKGKERIVDTLLLTEYSKEKLHELPSLILKEPDIKAFSDICVYV